MASTATQTTASGPGEWTGAGEPARPLEELYRPIRRDLEVVERLFDEELAGDLPIVRDLCDTVRSYRGKMLRPALTLLSGRAVGALSHDHHTLAAVIEMVHMATLVHDDVLDEADERRRQPTVGTVSGNSAAVLLGDYLISHAFHLCSSLDDQYASRRIGKTTGLICEGELLQNHRRGTLGLGPDEYFDIIRRKTGSLTAVACELGAKLAGADNRTVRALADYGLATGMAFQIIDDVLDVVGDPAEVGKTLGQDLSLGMLTLPAIHGLQHAGAQTRSALRDMLIGERPFDRTRYREWLDRAGSIEHAVSHALGFVTDAVSHLEQIPDNDSRRTLIDLAEFIVRRRF